MPANPVIHFRYGMLVTALAVATGFPSFQDYTASIAAANPVPSMRVVSLTPQTPLPLVRPQYLPFPYQSAAVAPANPVIATLYGQPIRVGPDPVVQPFIGKVSYITPPAPTPFRYGRLNALTDVPLVLPSVGRVLVPPEVVAPANPAIAMVYGQPIPVGPGPLVQSVVGPVLAPPSAAAPANPVLRFLVGQLPMHDTPSIVQPAVQRVPFFPGVAAPANPVIPWRIGQWIGAEADRAFVVPHYQPFPYWQGVVATANPVLPIIKGQWIGDATLPLIGIQGYQPFPWVSTAAAPETFQHIPIRLRPLTELRQESPLPPSGFLALVRSAPVFPSIPIRQAPPLAPSVPALVGMHGYERFPYWIAPLPANPVLPIRRGQWLGQAVVPLVGIHGFMAYPWTNDSITPPAIGNLITVVLHVSPRLAERLSVAQAIEETLHEAPRLTQRLWI